MFLTPIAAALGLSAGVSLVDWTFDRPGDLLGWEPNAHLTGVAVTNGALSCRAIGADPILEYKPLLNLPLTPLQAVEIRLKADQDGTAELFWSNTSTGRYGGFTQEKTTRFGVRGDGRWHTYGLLPFWHGELKLVRLRFDLYDGAKFELGRIRIVEIDSRPATTEKEFDFSSSSNSWYWFESVSDRSIAAVKPGGRITECGSGMLLSSATQIPASNNAFVSVTMTVDRGRQGRLFYATDDHSGLQSRSFQLEAGGQEHTYNLDMLDAPGWSGTIVALGLQPSDDPNATATLARLTVSDRPQGPGALKVVSVTLEDPMPREGRPVSLAAVVSNSGGTTVTNAAITLELPRGLELLGGPGPRQAIPRLRFDQHETVSWKVRATNSLLGQVGLSAEAANALTVSATVPLRFNPRLDVERSDYVPEPKPVRGPYDVGVYYFPGWKSASQWQALAGFPERKPVLGWYREGDPEVADWHIKWAVEHGITFFAYDWYWSKGARQLEHALHDGYFKARYRHLLKFCLLWANHNPPNSSSPEDCLEVTRFWIENYFRQPEYLTFDGRPVIIIFAPNRLTEDLGSDGVRRAFAAMRALCRQAGLNGLYLIACVGEAGGARKAAEEGYDSVTAYNWPGLGLRGETKQGPFSDLVEGYRRQWQHLVQESRLPLCPVPICGGWDSRPWHGENNLVRFGRTPTLFKQHLMDARRLLESEAYKNISPKALLVEAWNEWGEGSYIEPDAEFGFGYLDALREALTGAPSDHLDLAPADVGLGPYDVPPAPPSRTEWDFADQAQVWDNTMDLTNVKLAGGVLSALTTGHDPAFFGPPMQAQAENYSAVVLRMRLSGPGDNPQDLGQLFWRTTRKAESEQSSARFAVQVDGRWHDYEIPVSQNPRWRGTVTRLRLDPGTRPDVKVEVDSIRLLEP